LPADHIAVVTDIPESDQFSSSLRQLNFAAGTALGSSRSAGYRAATVHVFTDADEWFAFHEDESEEQAKDQAQLEIVWQTLHSALRNSVRPSKSLETAAL
jgi:hypothetical protein